MSTQISMRASDRDRERVTEVLRDAYTVGRLDLDEFLVRTEAACSAKTWDQLWVLAEDLPEGRHLTHGGFDAAR